MAEWRDDAGLFELMRRELFTAVVGDVMDAVGLVRQFLPPEVQPLRDDMVVAGPGNAGSGGRLDRPGCRFQGR